MFRPAISTQKEELLLVGGGDFFRPTWRNPRRSLKRKNDKQKEREPKAVGVNKSAAQLA
jgi:hypothetical protein